MRKAIRITLAVSCVLPCCRLLRAQAPYAATATACISSFYDAKSYNWFSYSNNCTDTVHVTFVARSGSHSGELDIRPGSSGGTGWSEREIDAMRGLEAYACPNHYYAVDPNGRNITKPVMAFRCKYRGY
jgi:hypothetical protein